MAIPTAEKLSESFSFYEQYGDKELRWDKVYDFAKELAKLHVEAALKAANDKAEIKWDISDSAYIDSESILSAYPLINIK